MKNGGQCSSAYLASLNCDYLSAQLSAPTVTAINQEVKYRGMSSACCFVGIDSGILTVETR